MERLHNTNPSPNHCVRLLSAPAATLGQTAPEPVRLFPARAAALALAAALARAAPVPVLEVLEVQNLAAPGKVKTKTQEQPSKQSTDQISSEIIGGPFEMSHRCKSSSRWPCRRCALCFLNSGFGARTLKHGRDIDGEANPTPKAVEQKFQGPWP